MKKILHIVITLNTWNVANIDCYVSGEKFVKELHYKDGSRKVIMAYDFESQYVTRTGWGESPPTHTRLHGDDRNYWHVTGYRTTNRSYQKADDENCMYVVEEYEWNHPQLDSGLSDNVSQEVYCVNHLLDKYLGKCIHYEYLGFFFILDEKKERYWLMRRPRDTFEVRLVEEVEKDDQFMMDKILSIL